METGWLIEKSDGHGGGTGVVLGIADTGGKIQGVRFEPKWTTPDLALRFARKKDAAIASLVLVPHIDTIASEHQWGVGLDELSGSGKTLKVIGDVLNDLEIPK